MGRSFRIAAALLRIPHLALSLFAVPLILSLGIVVVQLLATGAAVQLMSTTGRAVMAAKVSDTNPIRWMIYGSGDLRGPLTVCRWGVNSQGVEAPLAEGCAPDRLDVAIHVDNPESFDVSRFQKLFEGHIDRLHVCRSCQPDVVITPSMNGEITSKAHSVFGLSILFLPYSNKEVADQRTAVKEAYDEIQRSLGSISMHIPEISDAIGISSLKGTLPITTNIALLVVIALWLALKAHRKVLDYFSRNDVLLPLAAACGKQTFYSAIWILTLFRVGCFLGASIPLMYLGLDDIFSSNVGVDLSFSLAHGAAWLVALVSALGLATVIASIAELKHRHSLLSVSYRFLPLLGAFIGALAWGASFIMPLHACGVFRLIVSALPIIGIAPILVAPVTGLPYLPMMTHAVLAMIGLTWLLKRNARWFAAHLEEV
jgi:hypothetical protein